MRSRVTFVGAFLAALCCSSGFAQNLLTNGSFNVPPGQSGWTVGANVVWFSGGYISVTYTGTTNQDLFFSKALDQRVNGIIPGSSYTLTARIAGRAAVFIDWYASNGTFLGTNTYPTQPFGVANDGSYSQRSVTLTAPAGAASCAITITIAEVPNSVAFFDDIVFQGAVSSSCLAPTGVASISFQGSTSGCSVGSGSCTAGEQITFSPAAFGYTIQTCDTFAWTFGDGSTSTARNPTHTYTSTGSFSVTLRISNANGSLTANTQVIVGGGNQPPLATIESVPSEIRAGETAVLSWSSARASSVSITGLGNQPVTGSATVNPTSTTSYTITATGASGLTASATTTLKVNVVPAPVISGFTPSKTSISSGESVSLNWGSSGGTTAALDNGVGTVGVSGATTVSPSTTTTYTLLITGTGGKTAKTTTVTVNGVTPPATGNLGGTPGQAGSSNNQLNNPQTALTIADPVTHLNRTFVLDRGNEAIREIEANNEITLVAGKPGQSGYSNGQGGNATFHFGLTGGDMTWDGQQYLYITDTENHVIRRMTLDGNVTTFAGTPNLAGASDGTTGQSSFFRPTGIHHDKTTKNIYLTDTGNAAIRMITPAGDVKTLSLQAPTTAPGQPFAAGDMVFREVLASSSRKFDALRQPTATCTPRATLSCPTASGTGTLTTSDCLGQGGGYYESFAFAGADGQNVQFDLTSTAFAPAIVLFDPAGRVVKYVSQGGPTVSLFSTLNAAGTWIFSIAAQTASGLGTYSYNFTSSSCPNSSRFLKKPRSIVADGTGMLYVSDTENSTLYKVNASNGATSEVGPPGQFNFGCCGGGLAADDRGNVFIADSRNNMIREVRKDGQATTIVGSGQSGTNNGSGSQASFNDPHGVTIDPKGNLVIADSSNHVIRRTTPVAPVSCTSSSTAFCAQSGRFQISILARDQRTGKTDDGFVMFSSDVFGYFALPNLTGNTTDPAFFIKVLDGRPVNNKWWVFFATLTDVELTVTVTDTATGAVKTYTKPAGGTSATFDTSAFSDTLSVPVAPVTTSVTVPLNGAGNEAVSRSLAAMMGANAVPNAGQCFPSSTQFCSQASRFQVSIFARDQRTGKTDTGFVMFSSDLFGYFALPNLTGNTTDPAFFVKVLDGRPVNNKWWVFFATLTDVELTLTVKDSVTGVVKTYTKPAGGTSATFDTSAFN
ncbi:MAG TPA: PKD domain-containing protein [Thermoanaerobaculia bacterium]|nr:PKD domain-containing protein [Thermoanaerobaculia bacterium]